MVHSWKRMILNEEFMTNITYLLSLCSNNFQMDFQYILLCSYTQRYVAELGTQSEGHKNQRMGLDICDLYTPCCKDNLNLLYTRDGSLVGIQYNSPYNCRMVSYLFLDTKNSVHKEMAHMDLFQPLAFLK